jgi:hypothetical protein
MVSTSQLTRSARLCLAHPLKKGARALSYRVVVQSNFELLEHIRHVAHVPVMESQEDEPCGFDPTLTFDVLMEFVSMTIAVNFNHKTQLRTIEVYNITINGLLTRKLVAQHLSPL